MNCPIPELRDLPVWLLWRSVPSGAGKPKKVPYYADHSPRRGKLDSPEDRARLVDYATAEAALTPVYAGLGVALGEIPGEELHLSGIDLDNVRDPDTAELDERASQILLAADSYAEVSPSGTGAKIFGTGLIPTAKRMNCSAGLELYSAGRFFTVTGQRLNQNTQLADLTDAARIALELFPEEKQRESAATSTAVTVSEGGRNNHLTKLAGQMRRHGWEPPRIEVALQAVNLRECTPPLSEPEVASVAASIGRKAPHRTAPETSSALQLQWFANMTAVSHSEQLVKGLLHVGSLFVVYGESNSGKTFFVLDLSLAVAAGADWRGKRCRRGLVIYVAGEGASSVRARVAAYRRQHSYLPGNLPFAIVPLAVDFLHYDSVLALIAAIADAQQQCGARIALVIVDTFARAVAGGDENSAQDVGLAIAAADRIRAETGAAVGFVHHSGKDPTKGARGSSALRAATDTEILIEGQTGQRVATVSKQRDLDSGQRMPFELEAIEIGTDPDDGTPLTSCVVRHVEGAAISTPAVRELRGKAQRQFVNAMRARSETEPDRIWTLMDLRAVARELGQSKSTARAVVDAIANSVYMRPTAFGYQFTDGRDEERKGTK